MKKLSLLIFITVTCLQQNITASGFDAAFKKKIQKNSNSFATAVSSNNTSNNAPQATEEGEYTRTLHTFKALGLHYCNSIISTNPSIITSTDQLNRENIYSELKEHVENEYDNIPWFVISRSDINKIIRNFQTAQDYGLRKDLALKKINDVKGYGVFATSQIQKYSLIGTYTGIATHLNDMQNQDYVFDSKLLYKDTETSLISLGKVIIDSTTHGNITRFINAYTPSNQSQCQENCAVLNIIRDKMPHLVYFALKTIAPHEELTINYGPFYKWKHQN